MEKKTLFDFVYQDLKEQIITGRLAHGESLPSATRLGEIYHVGIRTVKDVLSRLKSEGLIHTEARKAATVNYFQPDDGAAELAVVQSILKQASLILESYETMALLMPPLFFFCARQCGSPDAIHQAVQFTRNTRNRRWYLIHKATSSFLRSLLKESGNLLFSDMYASLEILAQIPLTQRYKHPFLQYLEMPEHKTISWVLESLEKDSLEMVTRRFQAFYRSVGKTVGEYLNQLSVEHSNAADESACTFSWNAGMRYNHYYSQIARDLINKIGTGYYKKGSFLPPEAALAKEYGVSVVTVRKALAVVNQAGFARTLNGKGTLTELQDEQDTLQLMKDKGSRLDTLHYLSALQLMALIIYPSALLVFDKLNALEQARMEAEMQSDPLNIPLNVILLRIIELSPLRPVKTILTEVKNLTLWGYYFAFFDYGTQSKNLLSQKSLEAFACLKKGDSKGFASNLSGCYCHIFDTVRNYISKKGLPEAKKLKSPNIFL